jgi:phosphate transport system ATP-binding protein
MVTAMSEAINEGATVPAASQVASSGHVVLEVEAQTPEVAAGRRAKIQIRKLDFFYGEIQALSGVTLDIPGKQVTALIGPSGCGKSTLLRVLNRMYDMYPDERVTGEAQLDGCDILGPDVDLNLLRSRIGMVFQESTAFPMSIFDNVALGARFLENLSHTELEERVEASLMRAALWSEVKDRLSAQADGLSYGQQQRLCIARTLATSPEVLLFDEPTSALDPLSTEKIEALITELKRDFTILMVTHNMEQARRCADKVAFFYLGEMIEAGSTTRMFEAPRTQRTQSYISGEFG